MIASGPSASSNRRADASARVRASSGVRRTRGPALAAVLVGPSCLVVARRFHRHGALLTPLSIRTSNSATTPIHGIRCNARRRPPRRSHHHASRTEARPQGQPSAMVARRRSGRDGLFQCVVGGVPPGRDLFHRGGPPLSRSYRRRAQRADRRIHQAGSAAHARARRLQQAHQGRRL